MVATRSSSASTAQGYNKRSSTFKKCCLICTPTIVLAVVSPPVPSKVSNGNTPTTTIAPEQVLPPLGSTIDRPLEVLCDEEEEQRERKLNLNPLSRLDQALKQPVTKCYHKMNEQSKKMISNIKDVEDLISKKYDLHTEERKGDMLSLSELERKYEEVVILVDDLQEKIERIGGVLNSQKGKGENGTSGEGN
ncbi:hypothetical protein CQW23_27626 [Capsicum baccatum]|uniref:Uncharacterized protein n=1 Tax=Capsicum baccatum TaxID=33114 RepID=A0A2G2VED2_CAPBA|nr:hypothetical protein CQW23_27626 [Capsicum baccatum]